MHELIVIRYAGRCRVCGVNLVAGIQAHWDAATRTLLCVPCASSTSSAGGSAQREYELRQRRYEERVKAKHPRLGRLKLALNKEPQAVAAYAAGARGEACVGRRLDELEFDGVVAIHDRQIPGTRANIDHICVAPSGVFVIDTKNYTGKIERRDIGPWRRTDPRLVVGGRDRTKLIDGTRRQASCVARVIEAAMPGTPVVPVLCFTGVDWPLFARGLKFDDVFVTWPRALRRMLKRDGPLSATSVQLLATAVIAGLPPR